MPPDQIVDKKTKPLSKINKAQKNEANEAFGLTTITVRNETLQRNGILKKTLVSEELNFPEMNQAFNFQKNAVDLDMSKMLGIKGLDMKFKLEVSYNNLRQYKNHFGIDETQLDENIVSEQEKNNNDNEPNSNCKQQTKQTNEPVGGLSKSNSKDAGPSTSTPNSFTVTRKNNYNEVNTHTNKTELPKNNNNRLQSNTDVITQKRFPSEQNTEQSTQNKKIKLSKRCLPLETEISHNNNNNTAHVTDKKTDKTDVAETENPNEIEKIGLALKKIGTILHCKKNGETIRNNNNNTIMTPNLDQPMASSCGKSNSDDDIIVQNQHISKKSSKNDVEQHPREEIHASKNTGTIRNNNNNTIMTPNLDQPVASSCNKSNTDDNIILLNQDISKESGNYDAEQDPRKEIHASDLSNGNNSQNHKLTKRPKCSLGKKTAYSQKRH